MDYLLSNGDSLHMTFVRHKLVASFIVLNITKEKDLHKICRYILLTIYLANFTFLAAMIISNCQRQTVK
jgi:hypothetical protein